MPGSQCVCRHQHARRPHAQRPAASLRPGQPPAALVLRGRRSRAPPRTPCPTRPATACAPRSRPHAPRPPARPAAALAPRSSATCSARPPRQTLRGWLLPMPNLLASPTAPPLPSAPPSASLPCACGRAFGTRRGRPGRGCGGGGGPAGCPRPERCLGTENSSVRRHARAVTRRGLRVPRWFRAVPLGRLRV